MAPPENPLIRLIEDAQAARSYIPEIVTRLVLRSQRHMTAQDIEDLLAIVEVDLRNRDYLAALRKEVSEWERRMRVEVDVGADQ